MPWIRRSTTQAVLVHISDLHFGHKGQLEPWNRTSQYIRTTIKPDLVVATGDIADTPKKAYLTAAHAALAALDPGFRVCAGNHDIHGRGNILPWRLTSRPHLFNDVFAGRIPGITGETRLLGPTKIGLFSMDSSMRADTFARGYCAPDLLLQLRANIATHPDARQWDYCIVMVHHHPQPVRLLEPAGHLAVTALANAGTFVEYLATSHVDLALHGHEHCKHTGRYGTLDGDQGEVTILGAASATGAHSIGACRPTDASFNVLELDRDGTIHMTVHRWDGGTWDQATPVVVASQPAVRRRRILRRNSKLSHNSEAVKAVEILRSRTLHVRSIYPMAVKGPLRLGNHTSTPTDVQVIVGHGPTSTAVDAEISPEDSSHVVRWPQPDGPPPDSVEIRYCYVGGGVLWMHDLNDLPDNDPRIKSRSESVAFRVPDLADALLISVQLPEDAAPDSVSAYVTDKDGTETVRMELTRSVIKLGPGQFFLRVPYPDPHLRYGLRWPLPRLPCDVLFLDIARRISALDNLANEIRGTLMDVLGTSCSCAVVALDAESLSKRAISTTPGIPPGVLVQVLRPSPGSALARGWWGEVVVTTEPGDLVDTELKSIILPIRVPLSKVREPVALVRLGVTDRGAAVLQHSNEQIIQTLARVWGGIWDAIVP